MTAARLAAASEAARQALAIRSGSVPSTLPLLSSSAAAGSFLAAASPATAGKRTAADAAGRAGAAASPQPAAAGSSSAPPPCALRQLTRLHFVATDAVQAAQLTTAVDVARSYDLLSVCPRGEKALQQVGPAPSAPTLYALQPVIHYSWFMVHDS